MRKKSLICSIITLSVAIPLNASNVSNDLTRLAVSLCDFTMADDRTSLRRKLNATGKKLRKIYPAITCGNSGSLLRVATKNNAMESARFIVEKVGRKNLKRPESDGKNILEWTQTLVADGDDTKLPFLELYESQM